MGELIAVPISVLYDHGTTFKPSELMHTRIPDAYVDINAEDATKLNIDDGDVITIEVGRVQFGVVARVNGRAPVGAMLLPQSMGGPGMLGAQPAKVVQVG